VPLSDATRHLLDSGRIARLRHGAIVINTARGGTLDEHALAAALREGRLAGAALDVFEDEPLRRGSPLANAPNLLLTPHIAGLTRQANERVSSLVAERVAAALTDPSPAADPAANHPTRGMIDGPTASRRAHRACRRLTASRRRVAGNR
jgi:(S)-sulfolactate dehydrogenase